MRKRLICAVLSCLCLALLLTACGNGATVQTTAQSSEDQSLLTEEQIQTLSQMEPLDFFEMTGDEIRELMGTNCEQWDVSDTEERVKYLLNIPNSRDIFLLQFDFDSRAENPEYPTCVGVGGSAMELYGVMGKNPEECRQKMEEHGFILQEAAAETEEMDVFSNEDESISLILSYSQNMGSYFWISRNYSVNETPETATPESYAAGTELPAFDPEEMLGLTKDQLFAKFGETIASYDDNGALKYIQYAYQKEAVSIVFTDNVSEAVRCDIMPNKFGLTSGMTEAEIQETLSQFPEIVHMDRKDMGGVTVYAYTEKVTYEMFTGNTDSLDQILVRQGGYTPPEEPQNTNPVEPQMTNEEAREILIAYWKQYCMAGNARYAFADVTHDGLDEMFNIGGSMDFGGFDVYTVTPDGVEFIYTGTSDITTNGMYEYYLYRQDGKEYILKAGFFMHQGYPDYFYEVYSLTETGEPVQFFGNRFSGEYTEAAEEKMQKIVEEFRQLTAQSDIILTINDDTGEVYFGGW